MEEYDATIDAPFHSAAPGPVAARLEIVGRDFSEQALTVLAQHPAVATLERENGHIALALCHSRCTWQIWGTVCR
jgi:hypothetical protein